MTTTLEGFVDLKFSLEREISLHNEIINKIGKNQPIYDNDGTQDYPTILNKYRANLFSVGANYIDIQKKLLEEVNSKLNNICNHDWIEDTLEDGFTERNICYCSKCFCRKNR